VIFHHVAIDDDLVATPRASGHDGPVALFAGRLIPWKGAHLAIEAMTHLPGWRLEILGDGPDRERLVALVEARELTDRVAFLGWVDHAAVLERMRQADVFLFPSMHEEGGWAVGEAMAVGLPVVTIDRGGPAVMGASVVPIGRTTAVGERLAAAVEQVRAIPPTVQAPYLTRRRAELVELLQSRGFLVESRAEDESSTSAP
jgi:glycosyltransferase involved in cell wall biosynthesis